MARTVTLDDGGMDRFRRFERQAANAPPTGPYAKMFKQWAKVYEVFTNRRYLRNAAGGGDWPALKASTALQRRGRTSSRSRKGQRTSRARERIDILRSLGRSRRGTNFTKKVQRLKQIGTGGGVSILIDQGFLEKATKQGGPGHLRQGVPWGVDVGFSRSTHPTSDVTMGDIAAFHHFGEGNLPKRTILVPPDSATVQRMVNIGKSIGREIQRKVGN